MDGVMTRFLARTALSILVVVLWSPCSRALDPELMLSQYTQRVWTNRDGLPRGAIKTLAQSQDGYLWIGTEQGLARFDGVRFVAVALEAHDGRLDAYVNTLYADVETLWAGTTAGLYRLTDGVFTEVLTDHGLPIGPVHQILRDSSLRLWIVGDNGLYLEQDGQAVLFNHADETDLKPIRSISESPHTGLCFSVDGVLRCLEDDGFPEMTDVMQAADNALCLNQVVDSTGALWIGTTGSGLLRVDESGVSRWGAEDGLSNEYILALMVDRQDDVWFGSGVAGVGRIGRRGIEVLPGIEGNASIEVQALLEDREGNLWLGTIGDGLVRLSEGLFVPFSVGEGLREPTVRTVLEDHDGVVWIGTAGGGLHSLVDGKIRAFNEADGLPINDIMSLAVDRQGRLWVGTAGAGVFRKQGDVFVPVTGAEHVVFALYEDDHGRMWAGRLGGIVRLEGEVFEPVESLERINATAIVGGDDGAVWFADGIGGVLRWRDGEVTRFDQEQGFPGDMTLAVYDDPSGAVWIGAHLWGLTRFADGVPVSITTREGLCDDSVFSILEGPGGRLWMSSNLGVFAVEKSQLEAVARGESSRVDCRLFGEGDGMRSAECNGGQSPTAWRDSSGRLWYATVDGVVRVNPLDIVDVNPPQVVVEEITSGGETISRNRPGIELQLESDQRDLAIRYTAMTLVDSERVRFRYRLEGMSPDWVEAGERRVAYYTSLRPKSYQFEVQALVPGSDWSQQGATAEFNLRPRFHETRWFLAVIILALASLVVVAHRARVGVLRRRQRQLQALVVERTRELEEVNNTLEQRVTDGIEALRESDRMAAYGHLVAGVAHEVRHPIFALRAAAHLLAQKLADSDETREELEILGRETERMNQLVDDLLELARPRELELARCRADELITEALASFAGLPDSHLEIVHEPARADLWVLADRPALVQVLVNLVDNACRHAVGASRVLVGAAPSDTGDEVVLSVTDDGSGISIPDQAQIFEPFFSGTGGTGLGLAIASRLVREHKGRLSVRSNPGEETSFTIALQAAGESKVGPR